MFCILLRSAQRGISRTRSKYLMRGYTFVPFDKRFAVLMILNRQSYPSGKAAIIISSAEDADFTYIILEDKDEAPSIKGIFTNKGDATCYHPNGMMW